MIRFRAALILLLSLLFIPLSAKPVLAQSYTITTVETEGNKTVESSLILSVSGLINGNKLSSTAVQEAIHRIFALQLFSDVKIDGELAGGGIRLKITVKEHPRVSSITFVGNKHIKTNDIKDKIAVKEKQIASPNQIVRSLEFIKELYKKEGYYLAEVTQESKPEGENEIALTIKVKENEKIKVREVVFKGNLAFTEGKLRGEMKSKPGGFLRSGTFKPDEFTEDKDKIIDYCHKHGFIDASIVSDSLAVDPDGKNLVIYIEISEGNRYYFGDVAFTGNSHYTADYLQKQLKFKSGDIYNSEKYEESISNLYSAYQEDGYIHVRVVDNVQTVDSTLQVGLEVSEGVPAHINKVLIEGNYKTKEKVIRRELFSRPGQVFQRSLLMRSMRNLMVLNYFDQKNTQPDLKNLPNGDVDLVIKVEEKATGQIQAGAGYSAQDKLVGTLGLGIPNFRGNGQSANIDWSFGKTRNSISLSFTEPWLLDTPTSLGTDLFSINRDYVYSDGDFTEGSRGMSVRVGRRLSWPDNYFKIGSSYTYEQIKYYGFDSVYVANHPVTDPYSLLRYGERWQTTSVAGVTLSRDSRDLSQFATSGSTVSLTSEYSGGILGGDWLYHKHIFEAAKFTRLFWKAVLVTKMKLGVIDSPKGDAKIPYTERFAPGGTYVDGMIRGYDDGSVTPTNPNGVSIRGRSMLVYNIELQVPVVAQQIYTLLFADAGNSWLTGRAVKPFDLDRYDGLKKSVGAGFRIVIPGLGIIGADLGYGYNRPDGAGWKPHFQLGTTF